MNHVETRAGSSPATDTRLNTNPAQAGFFLFRQGNRRSDKVRDFAEKLICKR